MCNFILHLGFWVNTALCLLNCRINKYTHKSTLCRGRSYLTTQSQEIKHCNGSTWSLAQSRCIHLSSFSPTQQCTWLPHVSCLQSTWQWDQLLPALATRGIPLVNRSVSMLCCGSTASFSFLITSLSPLKAPKWPSLHTAAVENTDFHFVC